MIGEVREFIIEHYSKKELSSALNDPFTIPNPDHIETIQCHYAIQRRTAIDWLKCAQYALRIQNNLKEAAE